MALIQTYVSREAPYIPFFLIILSHTSAPNSKHRNPRPRTRNERSFTKMSALEKEIASLVQDKYLMTNLGASVSKWNAEALARAYQRLLSVYDNCFDFTSSTSCVKTKLQHVQKWGFFYVILWGGLRWMYFFFCVSSIKNVGKCNENFCRDYNINPSFNQIGSLVIYTLCFFFN